VQIALRQVKIGFVQQCGRAESQIGAMNMQQALGNAVQLAVQAREDLRGGLDLAVCDTADRRCKPILTARVDCAHGFHA
jgi:hypothetical protein